MENIQPLLSRPERIDDHHVDTYIDSMENLGSERLAELREEALAIAAIYGHEPDAHIRERLEVLHVELDAFRAETTLGGVNGERDVNERSSVVVDAVTERIADLTTEIPLESVLLRIEHDPFLRDVLEQAREIFEYNTTLPGNSENDLHNLTQELADNMELFGDEDELRHHLPGETARILDIITNGAESVEGYIIAHPQLRVLQYFGELFHRIDDDTPTGRTQKNNLLMMIGDQLDLFLNASTMPDEKKNQIIEHLSDYMEEERVDDIPVDPMTPEERQNENEHLQEIDDGLIAIEQAAGIRNRVDRREALKKLSEDFRRQARVYSDENHPERREEFVYLASQAAERIGRIGFVRNLLTSKFNRERHHSNKELRDIAREFSSQDAALSIRTTLKERLQPWKTYDTHRGRSGTIIEVAKLLEKRAQERGTSAENARSLHLDHTQGDLGRQREQITRRIEARTARIARIDRDIVDSQRKVDTKNLELRDKNDELAALRSDYDAESNHIEKGIIAVKIGAVEDAIAVIKDVMRVEQQKIVDLGNERSKRLSERDDYTQAVESLDERMRQAAQTYERSLTGALEDHTVVSQLLAELQNNRWAGWWEFGDATRELAKNRNEPELLVAVGGLRRFWQRSNVQAEHVLNAASIADNPLAAGDLARQVIDSRRVADETIRRLNN